MHSRIFLALLALGGAVPAAEPPPALPAGPAPEIGADAPLVTDPGYRLNLGDQVTVSVFGEPDLNAQQMIDRDGNVRLPLIGALVVAGLTVREAEGLIEKTYREQEMLRQPQVTIAMSNYAPRELTLLGAVRSPGTFRFPPDATSLDIRDVIARHGGFLPVAKGDAVAVTRRQPDGREVTTVVDVERMMPGRSFFGLGRARENDSIFLVYPGDRIFVPERLF